LTNIQGCPLTDAKFNTAKRLAQDVAAMVKNQSVKLMNAIWLETTGCSGNIISFLNSQNPGMYSILTTLINLTYNNTLMGAEGDFAFEKFLDTLDTEFVLLVDGAISTKDNGLYTIVANYKGRKITALDAVKIAGEKAKYVIAVGTCASFGGMSAAKPNPSESKSVSDILNRPVIRLPGCPCHPDWVVGTLAHLVGFGVPKLDDQGRPILFYGVTIHDTCTRRGFFENGIFASKFGEEGCMFKIGCKGPVTSTDCPRRKWNGYVNWPVGNNTTCIGCAHSNFPDGMEPFIKY